MCQRPTSKDWHFTLLPRSTLALKGTRPHFQYVNTQRPKTSPIASRYLGPEGNCPQFPPSSHLPPPATQNAKMPKCNFPKDQPPKTRLRLRSATSIPNNEIKSFQFSIFNFQISPKTRDIPQNSPSHQRFDK